MFTPYPFGAQQIFGMRVVEIPRRPKMQLSEDCPVTPEFRKEMNAWLLDFFGTVSPLGDGNSVYIINGDTLVVDQLHAALLRNFS